MSDKLCSKCHKTFSISRHQSGLVFDDAIFLCEDCCEHTPEAELELWKASKMHDDSTGMPIGLWLIHEQNKDKQPLISSKKE